MIVYSCRFIQQFLLLCLILECRMVAALKTTAAFFKIVALVLSLYVQTEPEQQHVQESESVEW